MWTVISLIAFSIIYIWLLSTKQKVPNPRQISKGEVLGFMDASVRKIEDFFLQRGFQLVGIYDCEMQKNQKVQVSVFINEPLDIEFAVIGIQQAGMLEPSVTWEFSSTLTPHGELCTNTNKFFDVYFHPKDSFIIKMPWVTNIETLYLSHLENLSTLEREGFGSQKLSIENTPSRITDGARHLRRVQLIKKRIKVSNDGSHSYTLLGAFLGVPLLACSMINPLVCFFVGVGNRSNKRRLSLLKQSAVKAKGLPENLKMYHNKI